MMGFAFKIYVIDRYHWHLVDETALIWIIIGNIDPV